MFLWHSVASCPAHIKRLPVELSLQMEVGNLSFSLCSVLSGDLLQLCEKWGYFSGGDLDVVVFNREKIVACLSSVGVLRSVCNCVTECVFCINVGFW